MGVTGSASAGAYVTAACMQIGVGCTFEFEVPRETHAVVMVEPHPSEAERVEPAEFDITPHAPSHVYLDHFGNSCRRVNFAAGHVVLTFDAEVLAVGDPDALDHLAEEVAPDDLTDETMLFVLPSRYCESDQFVDVAFELFGQVPAGWSRVQAICDWVHAEMRFDYGASPPRSRRST